MSTHSLLNNSICCLWLPILFLAFISPTSSSSPTKERIPYEPHCNSIVPKPVPTGLSADTSYFLHLNGYVTKDTTPLFENLSNLTFYLSPEHFLETKSPDIFQINAHLSISYKQSIFRTANYMRKKSVYFRLSGFWSASTGKLCMVGDGAIQEPQGKTTTVSGKLVLNHANSSNITTSLVTGTIESLDDEATDSSSKFGSISLVAYAHTKDYDYTLTQNANESCSRHKVEEQTLGIPSSRSPCRYLSSYLLYQPLKLHKNGQFVGSPFNSRFMSLTTMLCSNEEQSQKLHLRLKFSNDSRSTNYYDGFLPDKSIIGEGFWDDKENRLCLVACPVIIDKANGSAFVGDCSIGVSLWFPSVLSLKRRDTIVGRIWSNRNERDEGYFGAVSFSSFDEYSDVVLPGLKYKYKYTQLDNVKKYCKNTEVRKLKNKKFPDGNSEKDLRFSLTFRDDEGNQTWGSAELMSSGDKFYGGGQGFSRIQFVSEFESTDSMFYNSSTSSSPTPEVAANQEVWNVSYRLSYYTIRNHKQDHTDFYVEGIYNSSTGKLCMTGCQNAEAETTDCNAVLVKIQLPSFDTEAGGRLTGTISSTKGKDSSPLFRISSYMMYTSQAVETIRRMDIEVIMVIVSLTLSCICIGVQLLHVKKHPEVLPFISVFMLSVLMLGYMVPLILNFEAMFFRNQNKQNALLSSGGWLETNEVVVRLITMVAFLLQFRLLQQVWSARMKHQLSKSLWIAEKGTFMLCLPLYFAGGFATWFFHLKPSLRQLADVEFGGNESIHSLLKDLMAYGGLVLDGFLLPQIILNVFSNFRGNPAPLLSGFYFGTTILRAAPHLYDAYRARYCVPFVNSSYIYASLDDDFYSLAWDIVIPCGGVLFAMIVLLQQRYGGLFIVPAKLQKMVRRGYEEVSVVDS